jgi:hypothetical protein
MGQILHGKRHHDRGGPASGTATSREREGSGEALRRKPDDGSEVAQEVDLDQMRRCGQRRPTLN